MKFWSILLTSLLVVACFAAEGDERVKPNSGKPVTWEEETDIETFWLAYADSKGGLTWGRGTEYPEYSKVSEGDTFMVELEQGPCLMEFFHRRWRRANDVRRWDESVNEFGGCPHVFE